MRRGADRPLFSRQGACRRADRLPRALRAGALLAVMGSTGLAGCGGGPSITVSPSADAPIDSPVGVVVTGQEPGSTVAVAARARYLGRSWTSSARYRVGPSGTLDLRRAAPLSGSYSGADGMGLLWSLAPAGGTAPPPDADVAAPEQVTLAVGGPRPARVRLTRTLVSGSVQSARLRPGGPAGSLYADYVHPPPRPGRPVPGVVIIGGSEGGLSSGLPVAEALASHGIAALDLAYFGEPGLPGQLADIPIEYFASALRWLGTRPGVDPTRLFVYGVSRGSEAALLTAAHYPALVHGVVGMVPTDSAFCGAPACTGPGWTYQGRPVPFTRQLTTARPTDVPGALIPIGSFGGPVLLACAGHDSRWDSCAYSRTISDELVAGGHPPAELLAYPGAGHGIGFSLPYLPELETPGLAGATPAANPRARAAEWPLLLAFLRGSGPAGPAGSAPAYRSVILDGRVAACARVFRSAAEQHRGLSGAHPPAAGAFVDVPPARPSLWMRDTHRNLEAVWVDGGGSVVGTVAMRAMTTTLHPAPEPVPLILELAPGLWRRFSGAGTASLGPACAP